MGHFMTFLSPFLHPHYVVNILLSSLFFIVKTTSPICLLLFDTCHLELRDYDLLTFLGCIIVLKTKKHPHVKVYISTVCMFSKILNFLLFLRHSSLLSFIYVLLWILQFVLLPEPAYSGPEKIVYFAGQNMEDEVNRDTRVVWLIEFYASWSPVCINFAPVFAQVSNKYSLDNFKFGKINASRYSSVAEKYNIDTSSWTRTLPTLILFENGKLSKRRPITDSKGRGKFVFSEQNVIDSFNLNEVYLQCKNNPIKRRTRKPDNSTEKAKEE